jgi:hypothetical protein
LLSLTCSLAFVACTSGGGDDSGDDDDDTACYENPAACVDSTGTHHQYVADTLTLPESASAAQQLGLDLDGDPQARPDNALGQILSTLAAQGDVGLQANVDASVADGGIIILFDLQATALTTASKVGGQVLLGDNPTPPACGGPMDMFCRQHLDGNASFEKHAESPDDAILAGQIIGGKFTGGPGEVTIQLAIAELAAPITLNLVGARVELQATETHLTSGKLGGAVTQTELDDNVLPAIVDIMAETIAEYCTGEVPRCCTEGSTGETIIDLFDDNDDCQVTLTELKENDLISSLLAPDVDLLDENGKFNPRVDGVKDSLSLGVGFTGVGATFSL